MATCKDCIHFDVCKEATIPNPEYKGPVADKSKECRHFKNKADFVEVKHGEWIKTDRGIRKSVNTGQPMQVYACDCSCCGYHTGNQGTEFNYYPRCGAKMDGGNK